MHHSTITLRSLLLVTSLLFHFAGSEDVEELEERPVGDEEDDQHVTDIRTDTPSWSTDAYPGDPSTDREACHTDAISGPSHVCDPDGLLSKEELTVIQSRIGELKSSLYDCDSTVTVMIAVVYKTETSWFMTQDGVVQEFAKSLFSKWQPGKHTWCPHNGLLVVYVRSLKMAVLVGGRGIDSVFAGDARTALMSRLDSRVSAESSTYVLLHGIIQDISERVAYGRGSLLIRGLILASDLVPSPITFWLAACSNVTSDLGGAIYQRVSHVVDQAYTRRRPIAVVALCLQCILVLLCGGMAVNMLCNVWLRVKVHNPFTSGPQKISDGCAVRPERLETSNKTR